MKTCNRWPNVAEALRAWRAQGFGPFDERLDRPVRSDRALRVVAERHLGLGPMEAYDAAAADFRRQCRIFGGRPSCDGRPVRPLCRRNASSAANLAAWLMPDNRELS